jgi:quercetin dioxygenase-like cupin family protein
MPFFRFENLQSHRFNPHLSSTEGPVIEGEFMYFRRVTKRAGTGTRLHYHPNELMAFPLEGRINAVVGRDRRIVAPGTFVHIPPYAQHEFFATEDRDLHYLYIKDRTWTLIGAAADEELPETALSAVEVQKAPADGRYPGREKAPERSQAIADGLGICFHPMIDGLDAPQASGHVERWVEGTYIGFGFIESPPGREVEERSAAHEWFLYLIAGTLDAQSEGEARSLGGGDVLHVRKGSPYRWRVTGDEPARYAVVRSLPALEAAVRERGAADNWRG